MRSKQALLALFGKLFSAATIEKEQRPARAGGLVAALHDRLNTPQKPEAADVTQAFIAD